MNGPSHFAEGEERLRASDAHLNAGQLPEAVHAAAMAQAHFLAAAVTLLADAHRPNSLSWQDLTTRSSE